jgi:hypothetical protein
VEVGVPMTPATRFHEPAPSGAIRIISFITLRPSSSIPTGQIGLPACPPLGALPRPSWTSGRSPGSSGWRTWWRGRRTAPSGPRRTTGISPTFIAAPSEPGCGARGSMRGRSMDLFPRGLAG